MNGDFWWQIAASSIIPDREYTVTWTTNVVPMKKLPWFKRLWLRIIRKSTSVTDFRIHVATEDFYALRNNPAFDFWIKEDEE